MLGEEYGKDVDEEEDEEEDDEDELLDLDPVLEHYNLRHMGGINRVRAMPQSPEIIATWSDAGAVNLYNVKAILDNFQRPSSNNNNNSTANPVTKIERDPFFVYQGHSTEGYAMDWSPVSTGHLATGDCHGNLHLWRPADRPSPARPTDPARTATWTTPGWRIYSGVRRRERCWRRRKGGCTSRYTIPGARGGRCSVGRSMITGRTLM